MMNIEQLLERLDTAETDEEISEIGQKILEIDPESTTANWPSGKQWIMRAASKILICLERLFPE